MMSAFPTEESSRSSGFCWVILVPASLVGFDQKAAKMGAGIYQDLREKLRASLIAHADETSWRNDGVGHYVWFGGNENMAYFHIGPVSRSAECGKGHLWRLCRDPGARSLCCYNGIGSNGKPVGAVITKVKENQSGACTPPTE